MNILFIGDIVGQAGRNILRQSIKALQKEFAADLTVANCENAAAGYGITPKLAEELFESGVDVLTSGNHIWDKKEIFSYLAKTPRLLRPMNYPEGNAGHGTVVVETRGGTPAAVMNVQGRVFMPAIDDPFRSIDRALEALPREVRVIFVDVHAEATSEKVAMGWHLDGRVSAVVGTHTHIPTADETILPSGTAYITDVGMTGPFDSVIGSLREQVMQRFLLQIPQKLDSASKDPRLNGVVVEIDEKTGRARRIERIARKHGQETDRV